MQTGAGILMWHPDRAWFYSESYRCEQVLMNTDVAPSQAFVKRIIQMRTGAKEY